VNTVADSLTADNVAAKANRHTGSSGRTEQRLDKIKPVHDPIRRPVALRDPGSKRQTCQFPPAGPAMHDDRLRNGSTRVHVVIDAEVPKDVRSVRADLDASAFCGERYAPLQHDRIDPDPFQRQCQRQSRNARPDDNDLTRQMRYPWAASETRQPFGSVSSAASRSS
jgi:hypothetical protein